jgi:hypothetical protein
MAWSISLYFFHLMIKFSESVQVYPMIMISLGMVPLIFALCYGPWVVGMTNYSLRDRYLKAKRCLGAWVECRERLKMFGSTK